MAHPTPAADRADPPPPVTNVQPFLIGEGWMELIDGDPSARAIFDRHYSRRRYSDGREPKLFVGPGEKMVLMTADGTGLFVWRKFQSKDDQRGVNCAVFRREANDTLASVMIQEAMVKAFARWPGERLYTYVDPRKVTPTLVRGLPVFGFCFYKAGWRFAGITKDRGLWIWAFEP